LNKELHQEALAFLKNHHVLNLATYGADGVWAAAVFYVNEGFAITFLSAGYTRHGRNLAAQPLAAATIQADISRWEDIKGIQLEGHVQQLTGVAQANAIALYMRKFLFLQQAPPPIQTALQKVNWYQLTPLNLYLLDNSKGFGHRDQILSPT
jgi:uncharacterized protein YhbP (UPF0306 family)